MNKFDPKFPFYDDDSDYNTNANSYYKYLGRKTKLIKLLAKRIWEYDEELGKRFDEWDKQIENLDEEVFDMIERWVDDGTMSEVIANTINYKSNIVVSEFEPDDPDNQTYWYKDLGEPTLEGTDTTINTNVSVSEDEPTNPEKNVWFDY